MAPVEVGLRPGADPASTEVAGTWSIPSGILAENAASLALHARAGFRVIGTHERIGKAPRPRPACLSARAHSLLGDGGTTRTAIQQAEDARPAVEPDDLGLHRIRAARSPAQRRLRAHPAAGDFVPRRCPVGLGPTLIVSWSVHLSR